MNEKLISESTKYGIGMLVLAMCLIASWVVISKLWNELRTSRKEWAQINRESIIAFQEMKNAFEMMFAMLKK